MTRPSKVGMSLVGSLAVLSLVAGCGSSSSGFSKESAKSIVNAAVKDTKALKAVKISGSITSSGQQTTIDLSTDTDGKCSGTVGVGGAKADVVASGGVSYIHGDEAFWRTAGGTSADQIIQLLGDKWAKLPGGSGFGDACDLDSMFDELGDIKGTLSKGDTGKVGGKDAQEIISKTDKGTTHAWVSTEGKHYLLKVTKTGDDAGTLTLSDFNKPVDAKIPAATDVVDLSSLG